MKKNTLTLLLLLTIVVTATAQKQLVILHTNDTHSRIEPLPASDRNAPDMGGVASAQKSVAFGDFSMYAFAEREGVTLSRNPYLYQANGQVGLFVKQRFGGAVLQTLAFKYLTQHS